MNKDSSIKFRISKEEKEALINIAKIKNMTLTDYIMYCVVNTFLDDLGNN